MKKFLVPMVLGLLVSAPACRRTQKANVAEYPVEYVDSQSPVYVDENYEAEEIVGQIDAQEPMIQNENLEEDFVDQDYSLTGTAWTEDSVSK